MSSVSTPAALHIEAAQSKDVRTLAALAAQTFTDNFGHLYKPEALQSHLDKTCSEYFFREAMDDGDAIFLAYWDGELAGYAKAGKLDLPMNPLPPAASALHRLYVTRPFHKKGIGRALMHTILQVPAIKQSSGIYLGVWEHNLNAQRFYAGFGFSEVGEYQYIVGDHADRELIMRREQAA